MNRFDSQYGWLEARNSTSVTAGAPITLIAAPGDGKCIIVRRIHGNTNAAIFLKSGLSGSQIGPTIAAQDNFDIPGLRLVLPNNTALAMDSSSGTATNIISIQYAITDSVTPRMVN